MVDGVIEAASWVGAEDEDEGEKPKMPSKGLRRLVSLRPRSAS